MPKHMKGPWELTPEEWPDRGGYQAPMVYSVADEANPQMVCELAVRAEWEGNGNVIAASPEMYEALKEAFIVMAGKEGSNSPFDVDRWVKAVSGVEAAIAKAEGRNA